MSTRGLILRISREQAVQRALSQIVAVPVPPVGAPEDAGNYAIGYRLKDFNGDTDPAAPHCASWSYGLRRPTADCVGFVLWASGIDRCQPTYKGSADEWLSCYSLLDDAHGTNLPHGTNPRQFCRPLDAGEGEKPGDWMVTADHIAFVVRPATRDVGCLVVDCSPRHTFISAINTGFAWSEGCQILRPLIYSGE